MSGLLDDIQLARCRLPWGRGNRRVGSEVDKELRFDDIVLGAGVAGVVGREKGLEVRRGEVGVTKMWPQRSLEVSLFQVAPGP